jgi:hypothetical protein
MAVNLNKNFEFEYVSNIWALNNNVFNGPGVPADTDHMYSYAEIPVPIFETVDQGR